MRMTHAVKLVGALETKLQEPKKGPSRVRRLMEQVGVNFAACARQKKTSNTFRVDIVEHAALKEESARLMKKGLRKVFLRMVQVSEKGIALNAAKRKKTARWHIATNATDILISNTGLGQARLKSSGLVNAPAAMTLPLIAKRIAKGVMPKKMQNGARIILRKSRRFGKELMLKLMQSKISRLSNMREGFLGRIYRKDSLKGSHAKFVANARRLRGIMKITCSQQRLYGSVESIMPRDTNKIKDM